MSIIWSEMFCSCFQKIDNLVHIRYRLLCLFVISDINQPVSITNMPPDTIQIMENMLVGTSLYKFEYADADTGTADAKTWTMSFSEGTASRFFSIDPYSKFCLLS